MLLLAPLFIGVSKAALADVPAPTFTSTVIRADGTIRPFSDPTKCLYHKMNGYTLNEKPYISTCFDHNRYRWIRRDSGAIMSENRWTTAR